mgnify:CR=1 FL=1
MIANWINKKYLNKKTIKKISHSFLNASPYPHFVLNNFFNKNRLMQLKNEILNEKFEKIDKDLFSFYNTKELKYSKNKIIRDFFNFLSSNEFIALMEKLTNENKLNGIDMHAHIFKQGDYLLFHDDVVEGRVIAYIIYLSQGFNAKDGGRLQLYGIKNPLNPIKQIAPEFNSFVCFKVSNKSLHAVEEVMTKKQRLTIGGWFHGN